MENGYIKEKEGNAIVTIRNIVKVMSALCIIFFFCPTFLVSCGSKEIQISGMNVTTGIEADMGFSVEKVVDSHPIILVALFIPAAILIIMFLKKSSGILLTASAVLAVCDFITWMIFKSNVKKAAADNHCEFKTTGCFAWNMIIIALIVATSILALIIKINIDGNLLKNVAGKNLTSNAQFQDTAVRMAEGTKQVSKKISEFAGTVSSSVSGAIGSIKNKDDIMGYCQKCGSALRFGNDFCTSCGAPIPRDLIESAEAERREREEAARKEAERQEELRKAEEAKKDEESHKDVDVLEYVFCPYCGTKQDGDSVFCVACGKKM